MQKNLTVKALLIIAILLVFVYGIFGIPGGVSGDALKESLLKRVNLGLDLKGGTHLILEVVVNDAVNAESDHAIELLKEELQKANVPFGEISKPDPKNHPEQIVVKGLSPDGAKQLRDTISDRLNNYDLSGGFENTYTLTIKATALNDLKERTVAQCIEAIRQRVDTLGVSEPVIEQHGLGQDQILVQLPGVDDPSRVKSIIQSTARLEFREAVDHGTTYASEQEALSAHGGVLPPSTVLLHGRKAVNDSSDAGFIVSRIPVVSGTDIRDARESRKSDTNAPIVDFNLTAAAGRK